MNGIRRVQIIPGVIAFYTLSVLFLQAIIHLRKHTYQYVIVVYAHGADENRENRRHQETTVTESVSHGQHATADVAFQEMH